MNKNNSSNIMSLSNRLKPKKTNEVSIADLSKGLEFEEKIKETKLIEGYDNTCLYIEGKVIYSCTSADSVFFKVRSDVFEGIDILCKFNEDYPIMKNDKVSMFGVFDFAMFEAKKQQCFICDEVSAFYFFDLNVFLIERFEDVKQKNLETIASNIVEYSETFYEGEGIIAVVNCFNDLSDKLGKQNDEIQEFTDEIYGGKGSIKTVIQFLTYYKINCLKRPLLLLGITENEVDRISISMSLGEAYKIALKNPFRLPQIDEKRCTIICKNVLRMEKIPQEWIECGNITREVYNRLYINKWTSVQTSKLISMFPTTFKLHKKTICEEYQCSENFGCIYYTPIIEKEENVANFISKLIKGKKNDPIIPVYPEEILSEEQDEVVQKSLVERFSILTGAAGTGKTMCQGEIARAIINAGYVPLFLAFTGAAVQQLKKSLRKAQVLDNCLVMTIHSACTGAAMLSDFNLKYVIFDECSMISLSLFSWFINSFYFIEKISVILVGDINQLPPIDYGNLMAQILRTSVPVFRLTKNYRSQKGIVGLMEAIVDDTRLKTQEPLKWDEYLAEDVEYYPGEQDITNSYISFLFEHFYEENTDQIEEFSDDELTEIFIKYRDEKMFVTPYKAVVDETNTEFQRIFMEDFPFEVIDGRKLHLHDRVMNLVNNKSTSIQNGEIGNISEINSDYVVVKFRQENPIWCPYFSFNGLAKINKVKKIVGNYSSHEMVDGVSVEKPHSQVVKELTDTKNKLLDNKHLKMGGISEEMIETFFHVALNYTAAVFGIKNESMDMIKIKEIKLAYAVTSYKSQGNQFHHTIFLSYKPFRSFVDRRQLYTSLSRAKERLTIIASSKELLNSSLLQPDPYVNDNLAVNINSKLPDELRKVYIEPNRYVSKTDEYDFDDCDFDEYDFDDYDDFDNMSFDDMSFDDNDDFQDNDDFDNMSFDNMSFNDDFQDNDYDDIGDNFDKTSFNNKPKNIKVGKRNNSMIDFDDFDDMDFD